MKTQSNTKTNPLTIKTIDDKAILIFTENITEEQTEDGLLYSYDEYRLTVPNSATLEKRINANLAVWLAKAKQEEYDKLASEVRAKRNQLLADTDYTCLADRQPTDAMIVYRQALRDITKQKGFPYEVEWPEVE